MSVTHSAVFTALATTWASAREVCALEVAVGSGVADAADTNAAFRIVLMVVILALIVGGLLMSQLTGRSAAAPLLAAGTIAVGMVSTVGFSTAGTAVAGEQEACTLMSIDQLERDNEVALTPGNEVAQVAISLSGALRPHQPTP